MSTSPYSSTHLLEVFLGRRTGRTMLEIEVRRGEAANRAYVEDATVSHGFQVVQGRGVELGVFGFRRNSEVEGLQGVSVCLSLASRMNAGYISSRS